MADRFLGLCLRAGRARRGLTQAAVATARGNVDHQGSLSDLETGAPMREATFASWARALGATPRELLLEQLVEDLAPLDAYRAALFLPARGLPLAVQHAEAVEHRAALLDEPGLLGGLLRRLRQARGLSLADVGARAGVSLSAISMHELAPNLSEEALEDTARAYGLPVADLLAEAFLAPAVAVDLEPLRARYVARVSVELGAQVAASIALGMPDASKLSRFRTGGPMDATMAAKLAAWLDVPVEPPIDQAALRKKATAKATRTGAAPPGVSASAWRNFYLGRNLREDVARAIAAWAAE